MNEKTIIEKYKTPLYLYEEAQLRERTELMRDKLPGIGLCFALKAAPVLAGTLSEMTDRLEVCSPGEYAICIRQGAAPEKLLVSGVNKTNESIKRILELGKGKGAYTIESEEHFNILDKEAAAAGVTLECYIRLSSGNQFGVDKETLEKLIDAVNTSNSLKLLGIHFFSGTQKNLKRIGLELNELAEYGKELSEKFGQRFSLEFGPGIGTDYFCNGETDGRKAELIHAEEQLDGLAKLVEENGIKDVFDDITFEYGRFIAAPSARYYTGVADIKSTFGTNYAILEGGIHQITYYGSMAGMKVPNINVIPKDAEAADSSDAETAEYVLAGSLCSVNDILVRKAVLPRLSKGDVLSFDLAGAYALTEGIALFLSRDLPAILIKDTEGNVRLIRDHIETNPINDGSFI